MSRVEVFRGIERRRRWSAEEKRRLVSAAFAPGAVVSEIARQADVCPGQIYRWRQDLEGQSNGFSEVLVSPVSPAAIGMAQMIDVIVGDHAQVRIPASIPPDLAAAVTRRCDRGAVLGALAAQVVRTGRYRCHRQTTLTGPVRTFHFAIGARRGAPDRRHFRDRARHQQQERQGTLRHPPKTYSAAG